MSHQLTILNKIDFFEEKDVEKYLEFYDATVNLINFITKYKKVKIPQARKSINALIDLALSSGKELTVLKKLSTIPCDMERYSLFVDIVDSCISKRVKSLIKSEHQGNKISIFSAYPEFVEARSDNFIAKKLFEKNIRLLGLKPIFNLDKAFYNNQDSDDLQMECSINIEIIEEDFLCQ